MKSFLLIIIIGIIGAVSCHENENVILPSDIHRSGGVTVTKLGDITANMMRQAAESNGFGYIASEIKYDITISKIIYKTTYNGNEIYASGLLFTPKSDQAEFSMICFNHGTLFLKSDAPSLNPIGSGLELVSSSGYVVVMPDYLGYGESEKIFHPYYDQTHSASVVYDIINAGRLGAINKNVKLTKKVFMVGYSEGGYVTMAASKRILSNPNLDWQLSGIAAGAGGYDLVGLLTSMGNNKRYSNQAYLAFVVKAYNTTYHWERPMDEYFAPQYVEVVNDYVNGNYGSSFINEMLPQQLDSLFSPDFYSSLKNKESGSFGIALKANSLIDWKTDVPLRMYHGTLDSTVYFSDSQETYNILKENGSSNISFVPIEGGTHATSLQPMIEDVLPWLEQLNSKN